MGAGLLRPAAIHGVPGTPPPSAARLPVLRQKLPKAATRSLTVPLETVRCEVNPQDLVPLAECIACAEGPVPRNRTRCQFTGAILRAMYGGDEVRRDAGISASGLTGCLRQTALKQLYGYTDKPARMWPALRGTLFHFLPERHHAPHLICEVRFSRAYDDAGHTITGQMDEVDPTRALLVDYKSAEKFPDPKDIRLGGFKESWVLQTNVYRWLLNGGTRIDTGEQVVIPIRQIGIVAFGMMDVRKYAVPVLPDEFVETFVRESAAAVQAALDGGPWPVRKYDPRSHKLCTGWCPVRERCLERP